MKIEDVEAIRSRLARRFKEYVGLPPTVEQLEQWIPNCVKDVVIEALARLKDAGQLDETKNDQGEIVFSWRGKWKPPKDLLVCYLKLNHQAATDAEKVGRSLACLDESELNLLHHLWKKIKQHHFARKEGAISALDRAFLRAAKLRTMNLEVGAEGFDRAKRDFLDSIGNIRAYLVTDAQRQSFATPPNDITFSTPRSKGR